MPCHRRQDRLQFAAKLEHGTFSGRAAKPTPYGLQIVETCVSCPHREDRFFCNLPETSVTVLSAITSAAFYPKRRDIVCRRPTIARHFHCLQRTGEGFNIIGQW